MTVSSSHDGDICPRLPTRTKADDNPKYFRFPLHGSLAILPTTRSVLLLLPLNVSPMQCPPPAFITFRHHARPPQRHLSALLFYAIACFTHLLPAARKAGTGMSCNQSCHEI